MIIFINKSFNCFIFPCGWVQHRTDDNERVTANSTSQFFRIISYCFLNHQQHPVWVKWESENKHRKHSKLQPSLFTERISRIYYFRVVLTTEKTNFSIECGSSSSLFEIFMDTAIDCRLVEVEVMQEQQWWKCFPIKALRTRERARAKWSMKNLIVV